MLWSFSVPFAINIGTICDEKISTKYSVVRHVFNNMELTGKFLPRKDSVLLIFPIVGTCSPLTVPTAG